MLFSRGKKDKFSELLLQITTNLHATTKFFLEQSISNHHELKVFLETIKEHEVVGDTYVQKLIKELNETFITPIDREDILQLALHLDDVADRIEGVASLLEMYSVTTPTEHMKKFVQTIYDCVIEVSHAVNCLIQKKLPEIEPHLMKIKEHEDNSDNLFRTAVKNLFATVKDPIKIIQYKDIYEELEKTVDECRKVANTLDSIRMKNA